jgi:hypothetical protein
MEQSISVKWIVLYRSSYTKDSESKIMGELEAIFVSGLEMLEPDEVHELPATLLTDHAAKEYCTGHMFAVQAHVDGKTFSIFYNIVLKQ